MNTIQDQLKLERYMVARGIDKQKNSFQSAEEGGRVADTSYGKALTRQFLPDLVDYVNDYCQGIKATRFGKYKALIRRIDADKAALLALRGVFQDPFAERPLPMLAKLIGSMIEDEIKFSQFQEDHQKYYDAIIKDFQRKNTVNYRHRHRVLTFKMKEQEVEWAPWTQDERLHVGMILLDCLIKASDLVERKTIRKGVKTVTILQLTAEAVKWIEAHKDHMSLLSPEFMPCIVEPDDWTALDVGGYYTPELRRRAPMVKTRSPVHKEMLRSADLTMVMGGLNTLQHTSWRVNKRVHAVCHTIWTNGLRIGMGSPDPIQIPPSPVKSVSKENFTEEQQSKFDEWRREAARLHTLENDRVKKNFQIVRLMRAAGNYKDYDRFWYVWQTDFRGRFYAATAAFSPQGPDMGKALIEFADGMPLGERGFYWLKVHFANLCDIKGTYDERVQYTDGKAAIIQAVGKDPLGDGKAIWVNADKQFSALAALFELAEAYERGPENTINRIAVARDGSCNGLQHYAAILRDPVGAAATNVVFTGVVADVYREVGAVSGDLLRAAEPCRERDTWLSLIRHGGLPRKLAKKPVMTLPYGSTQRSCTDSVLDFIAVLDSDTFPAGTRMKTATYLTKHLWAGIGTVVTSAREAMGWIQTVASTLAKQGEPLVWTTPTGFPVYQGTNKIKVRRIHTQLGGKLQIQVGDFTDEFDPRKQASGAAPNFVHSMDASHLLLTVLLAKTRGIKNFAVIHDSYGSYACQTDVLDTAIREAFADIYAGAATLELFRQQQTGRTGITLPAPPAMGDLDVNVVKQSPYFFG